MKIKEKILSLVLSLLVSVSILNASESDWPSEAHIAQVRKTWSLDEEITLIRKLANYVYTCSSEGEEAILRLAASDWRSAETTASELDFMRYLRENGAPVVEVKPSLAGNLYETISVDGISYVACVIEKAAGASLDYDEMTPDLMKKWGNIMGMFHRLAVDYQEAPGIEPRPSWQYNLSHDGPKIQYDPEEPYPYEVYDELLAWIEKLPQTKDVYGLVHGDFHPGNFFVHNGNFAVFDFDDSCFHWFSYDVAVSMLSLLWPQEDADYDIYTNEKMQAFFSAYQEEFFIGEDFLRDVEIWLLFRATLLYVSSKDLIEKGVMDEKTRESFTKGVHWCLEFVHRHGERILNLVRS